MRDPGTAEQAIASVSAMRFMGIDHVPGRRVSVVGGGGKSTLARALAAKLGLPYIELDALFWLPEWRESTAEEMQKKTAAALEAAPGGWVADGHYWSKLRGMVLEQAETVVWVDMPWRVMWWRMFRRSVQRARDRQKICGENYESWRRLFSPSALWWWHIRNRSHYTSLGERMAALVPEQTPVVRLRSAGELERFYEAQELRRG